MMKSVQSKSHNVEIMINDKTDEVIEELFEILFEVFKISKNTKATSETVKRRYKGNQTIKRSFSICQ